MIAAYFKRFIDTFGKGWNTFWYTPADPLPLGLIRLLTGLIAIASLVSYTPDIERFLTDTGMVPVSLVVELQSPQLDNGQLVRPWRWSYFDFIGSNEVRLVHWCGIAVVVLYTLGLFSRVTSVLALIVVLSYLHRTPIVTMYHERILAFVMFFVALGPSGAALSLDRWLTKRKGMSASGPTWTAAVPLRMMQIQLCLACFMMAIAKLSIGGDMWWPGMATWWIASMPGASLVDLSWLNRDRQFLINFWSHAIVFFELAFPFLVWRPILQPMLVVGAVVIWLSVMVLTGQVLFVLALLTALLSFVSGEQLRALCGCCGMCSRAKSMA